MYTLEDACNLLWNMHRYEWNIHNLSLVEDRVHEAMRYAYAALETPDRPTCWNCCRKLAQRREVIVLSFAQRFEACVDCSAIL